MKEVLKMELKFLGRGGAFFPEEGNTAAYFVENNTMFLIDCGELIFGKIKQSKILQEYEIREIYCFITHLRSDHIGSLSTLIYYCAYNNVDHPIDFHIISPSGLHNDLSAYLRMQGNAGLFSLHTAHKVCRRYLSFSEMKFVRTTHQPGMLAFCMEFITTEGKVFYSGDTGDLGLIRSYMKQEANISRMYIEATTLDYEGNVHLPLTKLDEIIPLSLRYKVCLMHFNDNTCIARAKELGFQVVECD